MSPPAHSNPFPGLRHFEAEEAYVFFGREGQSDEIVRRLRRNRFLAIVGTSGSGKSSLIRAGLLPSLYGGLMAKAGSHWRIGLLPPGNDPIGNLARALASPDVLGPAQDSQPESLQAIFLETTLRRSALGLIEVVRQARLPAQQNVLVIVDQFEELFRFKNRGLRSDDDAAAFVKLLLEAARQTELPIYIVITMRSDFIGDCAEFRDLPEAVNDGLYLVPRMTRDQRRAAIEGPIAVAETEISPRLVNRLLNDVGDNPDQLPTLQHALMRTWDRWAEEHQPGEPIDLRHYEAIGRMSDALSRHADEAYAELPDERSKEIAKRLFQALTEKSGDNREVRRPAQVSEIAAISHAGPQEVIAVIDYFRRPGRSFLMPRADVPLTAEHVIDISHEALIRGWQRLRSWVDEERESAVLYHRLAEASMLHDQGKAGLWHDPELQIARAWCDKENPTRAWGQRYSPEFERAMAFLEQSSAARKRERWSRFVLMGLVFLGLTLFVFVHERDVHRHERDVHLQLSADLRAAQEKARAAQEKAKMTENLDAARQELENLKQAKTEMTNDLAAAKQGLEKTKQALKGNLEQTRKEKENAIKWENSGLQFSYELSETIRKWTEMPVRPAKRNVQQNEAEHKPLTSTGGGNGAAGDTQPMKEMYLEILGRGLSFAKTVLETTPQNLKAKKLLAVDLISKAQTERQIGEIGTAKKTCEESLALAASLAKEKGDDDVNVLGVWSYAFTSHVLSQLNESERAGQASAHALTVADEISGRIAGKDDLWAWTNLASSYGEIGEIQQGLRKTNNALHAYQQQVAAMRQELRLSENKDKDGSLRHDLFWVRIKVADLEKELERTSDAEKELRETLKLAEGLPPGYPEYRRDLSVAHQRIGNVLQAEKRFREALKEHQAGLHLAEELANNREGIGPLRDLAVQYYNVADAEADNKNFSRSADYHRRRIGALQGVVNQEQGDNRVADQKRLAGAYGSLSWAEVLARHYPEAIEAATRGLDLDNTQTWILTNLAHGYLFSNQFDRAKGIYLDNKDQKMGERTFAQVVLEDFKVFRENGFPNDGMDRIEEMLTGRKVSGGANIP